MFNFIHLLNETAVTYIPDVRKYGWAWIPGTPFEGWEAYGMYGEIKCFDTWEAAHNWRIREILESYEMNGE